MTEPSIRQKLIVLACLVFAGEMIFSLPFHIARFFRPTFLAAFDLSNAQLGDTFAVYGVMAMLAYFPGGFLADRFSPRKLITLSLFATALGGAYLAQFPSPVGLRVLFGYWGVTTILMFWAAMHKATREIGGDQLQGRAFGVLDGGRGLVAAAMSSIAIIILGQLVIGQESAINLQDRRAALTRVIYFYTLATMVAALLAWLLIPEADTQAQKGNAARHPIRQIFGSGVPWIALVVICAYCGYKGVDNYGLYAVQALGMSEIEAARFTSWLAYMRPIAAIAAGVLADRYIASRIVWFGFAAMALAYALLALAGPEQIPNALVVANLFVSVAGVFAVRGIYFALMHENQVPPALTGTAVGLISVMGFTPDIFFAPIAGRILDAAPGVAGLQNYFLFLTGIALLGLLAILMLIRRQAEQ